MPDTAQVLSGVESRSVVPKVIGMSSGSAEKQILHSAYPIDTPRPWGPNALRSG